MSTNKDRLIKKQAEIITRLCKEKYQLQEELKAEKLKVLNISGGVKFEDPVEKLHYEHWVDKTLKKRV